MPALRGSYATPNRWEARHTGSQTRWRNQRRLRRIPSAAARASKAAVLRTSLIPRPLALPQRPARACISKPGEPLDRGPPLERAPARLRQRINPALLAHEPAIDVALKNLRRIGHRLPKIAHALRS